MPEVSGVDRIFSIWAKKKALRFCRLGMVQLGHSYLGDEDYWFSIYELGQIVLGVSKIADMIPISGIYRTDNVTGETKNYRQPYYIVRDPKDPVVQANRQKFAEAVEAYQNLTKEQKEVYYKRAIGKRLSGYNLFLREYLNA